MAIKFTEVGYDYKGVDGSIFSAINDINLGISDKDEFIALIGETGSGKSTLVQHMNALVKPSRGTVSIYGVKVENKMNKNKVKLNHLREKVGLVFQFPDYQLFEETVERDIIFGPKNFGVSDKDARVRAKEVIKMVGLDESYLERSPFNLSGGEKKRVSIAGILAMEPDILVLDEPTSGLDPKGRDALLDLFKSIFETHHKTIILITHDMNIVHKYATRVLVMNKGHLVYDGLPSVLFKTNQLEEWNLSVPDVIEISKEFEKKYNLKLESYPRNIDELFEIVKEVLS
jgi:energy-coupling factor transport system ATP-binding protein